MKSSPKTSQRHSGSCLCGSITFSFKGPLRDVWYCHCKQCQKNYGMYAAFIAVLRKDLKLKGSRPKSYRSSSNTRRTFCGKCGSPITWDRDGYDRVFVLAGLLDGKVKVTKAKHIFTKDKGGYYTIHDHWPKV